jgi:hypothetical protein
MATKKEIKEHLEVALKEIRKIEEEEYADCGTFCHTTH